MSLPRGIPRPAAWASAVALFVYALGVSAAMAMVMPILIALLRHSPRLGWLGMLALWLAPIAGVAAVHSAVDRAASRRGPPSEVRGRPLGGAASWWAGFFAWAVIIFVSMTTVFVMLVLNPVPIDPHAVWDLAAAVTRGASGLERSIIWIVLAAYAYELEASVRGPGRQIP